MLRERELSSLLALANRAPEISRERVPAGLEQHNSPKPEKVHGIIAYNGKKVLRKRTRYDESDEEYSRKHAMMRMKRPAAIACRKLHEDNIWIE